MPKKQQNEKPKFVEDKYDENDNEDFFIDYGFEDDDDELVENFEY